MTITLCFNVKQPLVESTVKPHNLKYKLVAIIHGCRDVLCIQLVNFIPHMTTIFIRSETNVVQCNMVKLVEFYNMAHYIFDLPARLCWKAWVWQLTNDVCFSISCRNVLACVWAACRCSGRTAMTAANACSCAGWHWARAVMNTAATMCSILSDLWLDLLRHVTFIGSCDWLLTVTWYLNCDWLIQIMWHLKYEWPLWVTWHFN